MLSAIKSLINLGFRFSVDGDKLRYQFSGDGEPPEAAADLLEIVRQRKNEAIFLLRHLCGDCGGMVFWTALDGSRHCLSCDPVDPDMVDMLTDRPPAQRRP